MKLARRLIVIAVFVAMLVLGWRFAADHSSEVVIKTPLAMQFELRLWLALLLAFGLGVVVTGIVATYQNARLRLLARRYRKIIRGLESEVHQLRNLPLAEDGLPASEGSAEIESEPATQRALGRGA